MSVPPFRFHECVSLVEPTGRKASDLYELRNGIHECPPGCLFHHTHQFFLKAEAVPMPYPNDFAIWADRDLHVPALAEHFAMADPYRLPDIETLRGALLGIVDDYLQKYPAPRPVLPGSEFFFNDARTIVLDTGYEAADLSSFREALGRVNPSVLYYHFFQARIRLHRPSDDFSIWIEDCLGLGEAAARIRRLDPHLLTLEELRRALLAILEKP